MIVDETERYRNKRIMIRERAWKRVQGGGKEEQNKLREGREKEEAANND